MSEKIKKTDNEWSRILTPEEFKVLRQRGTEMPFTGMLLDNKKEGVYVCAACGAELFSSQSKFDSGSGWPSFYEPISRDRIDEKADRSLFTTRTEILCEKCGGHLGHVFTDGPEPTGLRYCVNSAALHFEEKQKGKPRR